MKNQALVSVIASIFAMMGIVLPVTAPPLQQQSRPTQIVEVMPERKTSADGAVQPEDTPLPETDASFDDASSDASISDALAEIRATASEAHLSDETIQQLEEIAHELSANLFEVHEKEQAIHAAVEALLDSLHKSKTRRRREPEESETVS